MAVILYAKPASKSATAWLLKLLERRPRKVAAIALANKMARTIRAIKGRCEAYRRQPVVA
jgi:transposase